MHFRILLLCCLIAGNSLFAQKKNITTKTVKLPNTIDRSDKRKVEKAKKLLNNGHLFEGEKILLQLRTENINHAYFHEALIQVQKQILDRIALQHPSNDDEGEYFLYGSENLKPEASLAENFIDNGLARSVEDQEETVSNIRLPRRDRKKLKKALNESAKYNSTDSIKNPIDAAQDEINKAKKLQAAQEATKSKLDRKNAKEADDLFLIPYDSYALEIINNSRLATLKHERVDSASHYLRVLLLDTVVYDSLLTSNELETMQDALDFYYAHDYHRAAPKFELLTSAHPDYFPAHLYLANSFFQMGLDTPAYKQYAYIALTFKERPEGIDGLSHYYLAKGKYNEAAACILKAILIYPEDAYFAHLDRIMKRMGKTLSSQWVRREVYPLKTDKNYEEIFAEEKSPWRFYQDAKSKVYSYAKDGILRSNEITNERYLEMFAWQEMLAEKVEIDTLIKDPAKQAEYLKQINLKEAKKKDEKKTTFPFARSMQKMGYLDCYIFISLFHHDLYPAFKDFVILHPDKVEKYFYIILNWEDEKFDQFREKDKPVVKNSKEKSKGQSEKKKGEPTKKTK